jgi:hypothetical protein
MKQGKIPKRQCDRKSGCLDELETRDPKTGDLAISEADFFCVQVLEKLAAF